MCTIQFCNLPRSSCRLAVHELCASYKAAGIFVSTAKSEQKLFTVDGMSLTNSVNSNWSPRSMEIVQDLLQPLVFSKLGML